MPIRAKLRHLRISPRKVRLVTDLVKGLSVEEAERQLKFLNKRAARPILKLLNSAVANAQHNASLAKEGLYVKDIAVEPGPSLKRWRPRAMGRATPIMKRTSHITIILDQKEGIPAPTPTKPTEAVIPEPVKKEEKVKAKPVEEKVKPAEEGPALLEEVQRLEEERKPVAKPKPVPPAKPYSTTSQAKKKFFSRQTFGNVKKYFRRKSF
jgi:large subunit ribosomal protein L22